MLKLGSFLWLGRDIVCLAILKVFFCFQYNKIFLIKKTHIPHPCKLPQGAFPDLDEVL